jgi:hypothetical protein
MDFVPENFTDFRRHQVATSQSGRRPALTAYPRTARPGGGERRFHARAHHAALARASANIIASPGRYLLTDK